MVTEGPLTGVKVVEAGIWVAAPAAGAILADWGADVVKLEDPKRGDPLRALAATGLLPRGLEINPVFLVDNRGKRSVAIDITKPEAAPVLHRLVSDADVFVTNLRTQVLERVRLSYPDLNNINPKIVYASLTGYGTSGPEAHRAAFDYAAFWSRGGVMASLGEPDQPPPTQRPGMGDHTTALAMAGAISAALVARQRTGRGQHLRFSLLRTGIWFQAADVQVCLSSGIGYEPAGRSRAPNPLFSQYRTKDERWIHLIMLQADRHWPDFCRAIGREELRDDPRFKTIDERKENREALISLIDDIVKTKTEAEWGEIFDRHGVYWGRVQSVAEVVEDEQARASGAFQPVTMPSGASGEVVAAPADFSDTPAQPRSASPELGQHTEEVLLELGYTWEDIAGLKESGTIG
jgi:crotonobetainyl-CoA:carnitine CoA-transferase CaiB-like acyl-CoA transferase